MKYTESLYQSNLGMASHKKDLNIMQLIILSFIAGCYIGFGVTFSFHVGGELVGVFFKDNTGLSNIIFAIFGLPVALLLIIVCGAELFTSDCSYMMTGLLEHKFGFLVVLKTLLTTYFVNFAGCLFMAQMMVWTMTMEEKNITFLTGYALKKVSHEFGTTFVKGILANWLVNLAVLMANGADDLFSKFIGVLLPISVFVSIGFEHSIANMFIIPFSMLLGSGISIEQFLVSNLIPTTLGNIVGGMGFVSLLYYLCFGQINDWINKKLSKGNASNNTLHP